MSTATAANKHSAPSTLPPPAVAAGSGTPPSEAAPVPRPLRPLSPSQIQLAEYATRHHVVTLPVGTDFNDVLQPGWWANVTERLRVCDKVDVFDARGTFYAELLIRAVAQSRPVQGTKGGARVHVLRFVELEPPERRARPVEYAVEFRGPAQLWCAIRIADGTVMKSHLDSREMAERHIATMAMAQA